MLPYVLLNCCNTVVVLLHCCNTVVGWSVVGALAGACRVGGSFRTWVNCFVLWGLALFWVPVYYPIYYCCTAEFRTVW